MGPRIYFGTCGRVESSRVSSGINRKLGELGGIKYLKLLVRETQ